MKVCAAGAQYLPQPGSVAKAHPWVALIAMSISTPPVPEMPNTDWQSAPAALHLPVNEIHVWRALLDVDESIVQRLEKILSLDEQERAAEFRFDRDRRRFIVGRGLLRRILARYHQVAAKELMFAHGPKGKPYFKSPSAGLERVHFNMSHSHGLSLHAVTLDDEVGVDLERVSPLADMATIAERFFSLQERRALREVPELDAKISFFELWTKKEAYIKATGKGLSHSLDRFTVSLGSKGENALLEVEGDPNAPGRWWLQRLEPAAGFVGAICVAGRQRPISQLEEKATCRVRGTNQPNSR